MGLEAGELTRGDDVTIAPSASIRAARVLLGDGVQIGDGVEIEADEVVLEAGSVIEAGNTIRASEVRLGVHTKIEREGRYHGLGDQTLRLILGDCAFLGFRQQVLVPELRLGDYTAIHNSALINGYAPCTLGHNCWVGQDSILNATERLQIGNNVRIGTQSKLWTHVASGELLEGCLMYGQHPLVLEDDVWLVGGAVVSPNLTLAKGSVVMPGAVVTKSTEPRRCYAGVPARDVTDKLRVWRDVTLDEKLEAMRGFVEEFHEATQGEHRTRVHLCRTLDEVPAAEGAEPRVVIVQRGDAAALGPFDSVFSLETKRYTKRRTPLEQRFIRFHVGYRARFTPASEPAP